MTGAATVSVPGTAEEESVTTETGGSLELTLLARLVGTARRDSGQSVVQYINRIASYFMVVG